MSEARKFINQIPDAFFSLLPHPALTFWHFLGLIIHGEHCPRQQC